jgi:integrase
MPRRFTDIFIRNLKPKASLYDLREAEGFGIRVFPNGAKSWIYLYTFEGRKRRLTLGKYPALALKEARVQYVKAAERLAQGIDPATDRHQKRRSALEAHREPTVAHLVEEYLERWAKPRKRSWARDQAILYKDVIPRWGKRKARDITRRDVVLLLDAIKARGAPIGANRTFEIVRRMFNFAVERGILDSTPTSHVKPVAKENRRDRVLSRAELRQVWSSLETAPISHPIRLALQLILVTGQRKGEVITLEWADLDLKTAWWTIPAHKTKNGLVHRVPLSLMALNIIGELHRCRLSEQWVFASPIGGSQRPITAPAVDHALRRCEFEGVAHFTPHDLRRTMATALGELGFDRLIQDKALNHKDRTVGGIYDRHSYDTEKRLALNAWADHLQAILTGETKPTNVLALKR